jgi:hypothetical protein
LLFNYIYVSRVVNPGMRVEVDDLNLIAFCPPAPPQKLVLVGAADDGREAIVGGILALSGRDVDVKL